MPDQTYKNHTRIDPVFHFFLMPLCLISLVLAIRNAVHSPTDANRLLVSVTAGLLMAAQFARIYALKNQNRIIRLEEQIRMRALGVGIADLSTPQLIALRFAPDDELPALAARAAREHLHPKQIKQAIVRWRADTDRV